jgi:hypothetical protein
MDTSEQVALETASHTKRQRGPVEEKRRIIGETPVTGTSMVSNISSNNLGQVGCVLSRCSFGGDGNMVAAPILDSTKVLKGDRCANYIEAINLSKRPYGQ